MKTKPRSAISKEDLIIEGFVARPFEELRDREGNRIIVKLKIKDFE